MRPFVEYLSGLIRIVTENSVIIVQVFDQQHFTEASQGFLGVVNVLANSVININTIGTSTGTHLSAD